MIKHAISFVVAIGGWALMGCAVNPTLKFERTKLSDDAYEASSVSDFNLDGKPDIACGAFWYEGPDFKKSHKMCEVNLKSEYRDDFSDFPMDVNGDGYDDIVSGGWFCKTLSWRENPKGGPGEWKVHEIDKPGPIETIRYWDVDGDGTLEIVPNAGDNIVVYKLILDAKKKGTAKFDKVTLKSGGVGHGLGYGDVNGDGRMDFIGANGWLEAPKEGLKGEWTWHAEFKFGHASVPILTHDVDEDGVADLIVGAGHDFGLFWYKQGKADDGKRTWTKMVIDSEHSQYHDIRLVDIDKNGKPELVTGARYRAHNGRDPGEKDPIGVYYYKLNKGKFERVILDYGPAEKTAGVGLFFWVADVDGNGWKDIVAPGKSGLYLFKNMGRSD